VERKPAILTNLLGNAEVLALIAFGSDIGDCPDAKAEEESGQECGDQE